MSFEIKLYENHSEENRLDKDITMISTLTGTLRGETSILRPKILVEIDDSISMPTNANYMVIEKFGRMYFITDITNVRTGIYQISGRVDVLSTYADQIRECKGIIKRSENDWNTYLNDGVFKTYQIPQTVCKYFTTGFATTPQYVLTTI